MRRSFDGLSPVLALTGVLASSTALAGAPTHVACVGDSITFGYMASSPGASYPSDLQNMFGTSVSVMNFGHSGATMLSDGDLPYQGQSEYTAATSFVGGAGASAVVDVVIMLGTNDTKSQNWMAGARATQFQTDATALVDHFAQLATHPTIYLALPPHIYTNSYGIDESILNDQIEPILRDVASAKGLALIDMDTPTTGHPELFSDGVHPTDTGYALLAMIVDAALVNGGGGAGGGGGSGAAGKGGSGAGGGSGSGGVAAGGSRGASGGAIGSGGASTAGTGGGSGGAVHGGTGGTSTGGTGGTGMTGAGGMGTGGTRTSSGGTNATASGGAGTSASGGAGGDAPASGGTKAGGGQTGGTAGGDCAVSPEGAGAGWAGALALFGATLVLSRARGRRTRQTRGD